MKAITVGELKEALKNYDDNLIVFVMRDASGDLHPITAILPANLSTAIKPSCSFINISNIDNLSFRPA